MIELLNCGYACNGKVVIHDLSLRFDGRRTAIIGANGSGKTTLARLLNGLLLPTSGEVRVFGVSTKNDTKAALRRVGMVFQNADSQIVMPTVEEDLAFGLQNLRMTKSEVAVRVRQWLERFNMAGKRDWPAYLLSGGEKKLLTLLSVLIMEPDIVVLDEPFSSLDFTAKKRVASLVDSLVQPVILITHDLEEIANFERAVCLHTGETLADGAPLDVIRTYMEAMSGCLPSTFQAGPSFTALPPG